ncbi:MAG TPA: sodium:solute symporter family protein [Planctomycetota bacterium]|jgi:SSS family solute:Na+ symporter|nr:sodium:solute symporter family protein [Planctomycetota bacterium]OQC18989.1 MAG: Sodium/glucose cotransporter [Planctomycetes bacterium ADurb.Bin069]HNS00679.1 sodium:solute symporter family protein [Planctomycetota bacterium]HNU27467.1 sodium:solute symporter family protein [Planctomycetota bacterium]HOE31486.1 sodium:solute symporter family protein [Planctomycetota bacterium]
MQPVALAAVDYIILLAYTAFVIGIGFALRRYMKTSEDFFLSGRSIPAWVTGLAFISANLGALELVGMAASGAKYGIATSHFYWVGAIPAMVFLAVFMMPFYYGSKARSVPEYLKLRFDERTRCLNSITFAVMTVFASGISMNALAKLLNQLLGWNYNLSLWICSAVVLLYVFKGGLTSAIYTEVLQFFMIVLGFTPVVYLGLKDVGGWDAMKKTLASVAQDPGTLELSEKTFAPEAWSSAWQPLLGGPSANPMGVDIFAMVFGLGFVLSFGYWCTNFLVVQRAMAARNMSAARRTPLIAAVPKMLFPALVILPGMLAVTLAWTAKDGYRLPPRLIASSAYAPAIEAVTKAAAQAPEAAFEAVGKAVGLKLNKIKVAALVAEHAASPLEDETLRGRLQDAVVENDYDGVILSLVKKYCPPGLLGLALTALLASFMSGMAGNVTAFNTVWTYDIYQAYIARHKSDAHYMWMGRVITVVGVLLSIACAYFASNYNNAMDIVQLVFGFVNAPLFATFLLGMFWARTTAHGAFYGLLGGTLTSALFHALTLAAGNTAGIKGGYAGVVWSFPSEMAQNFWLASFAFTACLLLTLGISLATRRTKSDAELGGLVYSLTPRIRDEEQAWYLRPAVLGAILLAGCVILNYIFW